jgi:hypothetical protein
LGRDGENLEEMGGGGFYELLKKIRRRTTVAAAWRKSPPPTPYTRTHIHLRSLTRTAHATKISTECDMAVWQQPRGALGERTELCAALALLTALRWRHLLCVSRNLRRPSIVCKITSSWTAFTTKKVRNCTCETAVKQGKAGQSRAE